MCLPEACASAGPAPSASCFPHVANVFYAEALRAIEIEAHRNGFTVLLLTHHEDQSLQQTQLATLKQFQCDGIILIAAAGTQAAPVGQILGATALVALDRPLGQRWDSVTLHNYKAGRQATEHLLSHGHRHLVAITAPYHLETLNRRQKGFLDAVRGAGVSGQIVTLRDEGQLRAELGALFQKSRGGVTGVLSLSYSLTVGSLRAMRSGGTSLAERGFIAIDDLEFATLLDPPLTTVAQPARSLAKLAIDRLLKRIDGNKSSIYHAKLAGELIIRGSCGCAVPDSMPSAAAD